MSQLLPRNKPHHANVFGPTSAYYRAIAFALLPALTAALPIRTSMLLSSDPTLHTDKTMPPLTATEYWGYMISSITLVLLGGVFSGLTLGLMGQDEVHLKVIAQSGSSTERKSAKTVLKLLSKGKHWLLVTLLLSNVVTNETLPVILDRFLGGGAAAVFGSTVLIVIFGEIIPQSICVRYGLQIGAFFSPFVEFLMYLMYPVAYPIAKLLDWSLGQDHGTLYGKSGLKTLVNLHHTMGVERLSQDEVTIINAVLDLKDKAVGEVMTPIDKVFTLPSDTILDEATVERIFSAGFSRIPIHMPGEPANFVGMLLVRILISYDPEDALPVSAFPLATLPETGYYTSCLNILNYFQEGKSHMVVVSDTPGMDTGGRGVVTLEDVIEELIGEEIVDESDVYVDVDRSIKRSIPGPLAKRNVTHYLHDLYNSSHDKEHEENGDDREPMEALMKQKSNQDNTGSCEDLATPNPPLYSPESPTYILKKDLKDTEESINQKQKMVVPKELGAAITRGIKPSNLAANPLHTNNEHIKIKKQPQLQVPADTLTKLSNSKGKTPLKKRLPSSLRSHLIGGKKNASYGSVNKDGNNKDKNNHSTTLVLPKQGNSSECHRVVSSKNTPGVYESEVGAFVQGVNDNVQRSNAKGGRKGSVTARRIGTNNKATPVIKPVAEEAHAAESVASGDSNSSDGIVESSIVTDSGFRKTVIEETMSDEEERRKNEENKH